MIKDLFIFLCLVMMGTLFAPYLDFDKDTTHSFGIFADEINLEGESTFQEKELTPKNGFHHSPLVSVLSVFTSRQLSHYFAQVANINFSSINHQAFYLLYHAFLFYG